MQLENLRKIVENYDPLNNIEQNPNNNFASLIAVEQVLKKYQDELYTKLKEYEKHASKLFKTKCKIIFKYSNGSTGLYLTFAPTITQKEREIELIGPYYEAFQTYIYRSYNPILKYSIMDKESYDKVLKEDVNTKELKEYFNKWIEKFNIKNNVNTNIGLCVDFFQSYKNGLQIVLSDRDKEYDEINIREFLENEDKLSANFIYLKDLDEKQKTVRYKNDKCKDFLNETQLANIYSTIKVDISVFPQEIQDEIKKYESYYKLRIHEQANADTSELKKMQQERLVKAYNKFKEVIEELNNLQSEVELEKIKLDNIESMFFKNNGIPNTEGYIEIDNIFKNNMMLRMLDLSEIDLTNVDIRNMNFSGTNIHIDPQKICNKDMTNVNATDVKFSPFQDSFDDVILDGAIITDWEAAIDLEKIKSYNKQTIIPDSCKKENTFKM